MKQFINEVRRMQLLAGVLKENIENPENTLTNYFSSRDKSVKSSSNIVDGIINKSGIDSNIKNELIDAIIDLIDEIESEKDYDY